MVVARNEVAAIYDREKMQHGRAKKIMKKGLLDAIIKSVQKRCNILDGVVISPHLVHK